MALGLAIFIYPFLFSLAYHIMIQANCPGTEKVQEANWINVCGGKKRRQNGNISPVSPFLTTFDLE